MKDKKIIILIVFIIGIIILSIPKKEENKEIIDKENIVAIKLKDGSNYTDTDTVPTSGYTLNTTESICKDTSGNKIDTTFEYSSGKVKIPVTKKGTKCSLVFDKEIPNATEYLIAKNEMINENGYRYEGQNPNNYVTFNNETWRIIGVFDVTNADTNKTESLVKIIRNESIGNLVWGSGNYWNQSSLRELLNEGDYYNKTGSYSSNGLTIDSKNMIANVEWSLRGAATYNTLTIAELYRSQIEGEPAYQNFIYSINQKVGLIYPADYGYSVLESSYSRTSPITSFYMAAGDSWLYKEVSEWTMMPVANDINTWCLYYINSSGNISYSNSGAGSSAAADNAYSVRPSVYLKSNVKILDNGKDGSSSKPYDLAIS